MKRERLAHFLLSGGTAALVDYSTFLCMFYIFSAAVVVANIISFSAGLVTSFLLNKKLVFKGNHEKGTHVQIAIYISLALLNLIISSAAIDYLHSMGVAAAVAKFILIGVVAIWNYFIFRKLIFNISH
jgi:putative flippase GtrA